MTASLTRIKTLEQCGAKYDYRYLQRIKDTAGPAAQRGTDIHRSIEGFIREGTPLAGPLEFYHGFLTQLKQNPVPIESEIRIALTEQWKPCPEADVPWLLAYLDLLRRVEASANIWDWKSGKIYPDHDDQKELYSLMVLAAFPEIEVVTFAHVYVDLGKNREKIFSRFSDYERLKAKWEGKVRRLDSVKQNELIPNPSFLCRYCSYSSSKGGPCRF